MRHSALLACLFLILSFRPALAADIVRAELVAENPSPAAGEEVMLGLHFRIPAGWHTFWRNPGDAGYPPEITWKETGGVRIAPTLWPVPRRFRLAGNVVTYGYEDEVLYLLPARLPRDVGAGSELLLVADAEWLVCDQSCVPETAELDLVLAVGGTVPPSPGMAELFAGARHRLPVPAPFSVVAERRGQSLRLAGDSPLPPGDVFLFPLAGDTIRNAAPQLFMPRGDRGFTLTLQVAEETSRPGTLGGVLAVTGADGRRTGYMIQTPVRVVNAGTPAETGPAPLPAADTGTGGETGYLPVSLLLALAGGVILNLMPCVFPVLAVKAAGLGALSRRRGRLFLAESGFAYTAGIVLSLVLLALVLLVLRQGGESLGWGFHLQSPGIVAVLALLMMAIGLNLSGVWELRASGAGDALARKRGLWGSFFTGALVVVIAAPCSAPFMATAIGHALFLPPLAAILVFVFLGLGMALPWLLLCLFPVLTRFLPPPGRWMTDLREGLAFPVYGAAGWLAWILAQQVGRDGLALFLAALVLLAFAMWLFGRAAREDRQFTGLAGLSVAGLAVAMALSVGPATAGMTTVSPVGKHEPFSRERVALALAGGQNVLVNVTAAWCASCLVNERLTLHRQDIVALMQERNVLYLVADWTGRDSDTGRYLAEFRRAGPPLYVLYTPGGEVRVLPQFLSPGHVRKVLGELPPGGVPPGPAAGRTQAGGPQAGDPVPVSAGLALRPQPAVQPPSTTSDVPVTRAEASEAR